MPNILSRTDLAYLTIRGELRAGTRLPGAGISVKEIADAMRISSTPVREALERLVGEGLVVPTGARAGFQVARLTAAGLAQVIELHGLLADEAHARLKGRNSTEAPCGIDEDPVSTIEASFGALFWERINGQLSVAAARASALLAPYRVHEASLFPEWRLELAALANALRGSRNTATGALRIYHRRRATRTAEMISLVNES